MRQFGLEQLIPDACDTQATLHAIDQRTTDKNFLVRYRLHVDAWNARESVIVQGENYTGQSLGMYMAWYRQITILRLTNPTSAQPSSHYHPTATILAERIRSVLVQCSDATQGASALPVDVGYRLCTQTLGSINMSLTEALCLTGYDYLIPTRPTTIDDDTLHTPSTSGSRHRGSSSRGSSRGSGRSSSRGRSSESPSTSTGAMSPFVPPGPLFTPPHPSPPNRILTYQRASQRRAPILEVITEAEESTSTSTTDARTKRGRGV
ncbi:uncharacterized protein LOC130825369 [Amaranthus tricolor]|uniref:uncharacterized protein LOC130825369 n=1 Tax=Amaranthus tricolor TaxID=29722 RepID=UPI002583F80F|nr:uncharacterized protein LOC130825369 [Amaranthus tricolor]